MSAADTGERVRKVPGDEFDTEMLRKGQVLSVNSKKFEGKKKTKNRRETMFDRGN
jgi:hypothetical protein